MSTAAVVSDDPPPSRDGGHAADARGALWPWVRSGASLAVLVVAAWLLVQHLHTITRSATRLAHVDLVWMAGAAAAEAGSMIVFGRMQQLLLRASGARLPLRTMVGLTTAANAVTSTLPAGVGWAAAWLYDQLGSRGVGRFARVWTFLVAGGVSSFALFLVIGGGVELAGSEGPLASLRWLVLLLAAIPVCVLVVARARHGRAATRVGAGVRRARPEPGGADGRAGPFSKLLRRGLVRPVRSLAARFGAVRLAPSAWAALVGLALANWLLDCFVVVAALEGLDVRVPWKGILVVYGITQICQSVPITPGGIGVVTGTMTVLLHAYGVALPSALATVLVYRVVSFWVLVPIGWAVWSVLEAGSRPWKLGAWPRQPGNLDAAPAASRELQAAPEGA